jgi:hypothetical protein
MAGSGPEVAMILALVGFAIAQEPPPPPFVEVRVAGTALVEPAATTLQVPTGGLLELRATVLGGQRAWCMDPERYGSFGGHGLVTARGLDGCSYEVSTGHYDATGAWSVMTEAYSWNASRGTITPKADSAYATFLAPNEPGFVDVDVSGSVRWHLDSVTDRDVEDVAPIARVRVEVTGPPTRLTREQAYDLLIRSFLGTIPPGPGQRSTWAWVQSPGFANNLNDLLGVPGYAATTCGGYQGQVLALLDRLRASGSEDERAIFEHFDYGPIHAYYGGHQAVVVYPRGSDWTQDGRVLDPWPNARPEVFTMAEWAARFSFGRGPSSVYTGRYPLTGSTMYPDPNFNGNLASRPELLGRMRALPPAERSRLLAMTPEERVAALEAMAPPSRVAVAVHSPVRLLVRGADGRRVGYLPTGEFVYEIEEADVDLFPEPDGQRGAVYFLPEGDYDVVVVPIAEGPYDVTWAVPDARPRRPHRPVPGPVGAARPRRLRAPHAWRSAPGGAGRERTLGLGRRGAVAGRARR